MPNRHELDESTMRVLGYREVLEATLREPPPGTILSFDILTKAVYDADRERGYSPPGTTVIRGQTVFRVAGGLRTRDLCSIAIAYLTEAR